MHNFVFMNLRVTGSESKLHNVCILQRISEYKYQFYITTSLIWTHAFSYFAYYFPQHFNFLFYSFNSAWWMRDFVCASSECNADVLHKIKEKEFVNGRDVHAGTNILYRCLRRISARGVLTIFHHRAQT